MCVSDIVLQFVHIFLSPFTLSNILTWGKHICFPMFKTQHPPNSTNFVPRFSLAICSICLFRSTTRPNKVQRMMGMYLPIVAVVPAPSAAALLQLKNNTFGPEDLLCETVTVQNDIKTLFSSWYCKIDNTESLVLGLKEKVV